VDVDGKPTAAVVVSSAEQKDITLYFDKATGLLAKVDRIAKDEFQNFKEVKEEIFFREYVDRKDGSKEYRKMKTIRDGKDLLDSEFSGLEYVEKFAAETFTKPK
jgi:hypothetical protein